jgi:KipI family sensor histidine kinase inhibitor
MMAPAGLRILPCGDSALSVEFGADVDPAINARVLGLDAALAAAPVAGVVETIPTYRSLFVQYDPVETGFAELVERLRDRAGTARPASSSGRVWTLPVVYGGEYGIDLDAVARTHDMDTSDLVRRHAGAAYRIYMIGFTPGFAYLGGLDPTIATPRRAEPRARTPEGAIMIGGVQACVQCLAAPSGWHVLGRTPVRNFAPGRDPVFLMAPGDGVRFRAVPARDWAALERDAARGAPVAELAAP